MTYCRRHGRRTDICGCSRSYPCLVCGGLFPSSDHVCPGEHTQPTDSRSDPLAGNPSVVALEAGRRPQTKPAIFQYGEFGAWLIAWHCCSPHLGPNEFFGGGGTWREAMDATHAHVREHHALTSANHTPTWEPCGRGICAANAGHEGTCEEASGFYDWTPEFYDDDPDPSTEAWRELLATSREDT